METRRLGKTNHLSTVVAFGTYAIGHVDQDKADQIIETALARGINHFDVAPSYGAAEERLGSYLKRHPLPELFISCKTQVRDKLGAKEELHRTLLRLGRSRFDLFQLHAVCSDADLEACFAPGGSMEAILEARDEGIVSHIGVTGHGWTAPRTHAAALRRFEFATVMTSCNAFMHAAAGFRLDWEALENECQARDVGIHVLKATAKGPWAGRKPTHNTWYEPLTDQREVDRAVAWVLARPVTTLCSAGDASLLPGICDAAERAHGAEDAGARELLATDGHGDIFDE